MASLSAVSQLSGLAPESALLLRLVPLGSSREVETEAARTVLVRPMAPFALFAPFITPAS